jgi:NAD(P)-dependent dehydrogenase (short-subunit alcohol dehydrogenase family)
MDARSYFFRETLDQVKKVNLFDLTNEVAVVVGGTGVLGGAIGEGLAMAGAKVAILGRNQQRGETRVRSIKENGGTAEFVITEALDRQSLTSARENVTHQTGQARIIGLRSALQNPRNDPLSIGPE